MQELSYHDSLKRTCPLVAATFADAGRRTVDPALLAHPRQNQHFFQAQVDAALARLCPLPQPAAQSRRGLVAAQATVKVRRDDADPDCSRVHGSYGGWDRHHG